MADFTCQTCREDYELKSKKGRFGSRIVDGAYGTIMQRLAASDNPNLICMNYDLNRRSVTDLFVVPKQFFTADLIEARPPRHPRARPEDRAECEARRVGGVQDQARPRAGVRQGVRGARGPSKRDVQAEWASTLFLRGRAEGARGWLIEVMRCVRGLRRSAFSLDDLYACEARLSALYRGNSNVRPKTRQQLQVLQDQGYIAFEGRGRYRVIAPA